MFPLSRLAHEGGDSSMHLLIAKRLLNDPGHYFFFSPLRASYTETHGHPSPSLRQDQLHTRDTHQPELPQRKHEGDPGREKEGG